MKVKNSGGSNFFQEFLFFFISAAALLCLAFYKDLYLIWGAMLGIGFFGLIHSFIKVPKASKILASVLAFIIGFSFAVLSSSISSNNIAKGDDSSQAQISLSSSELSSIDLERYHTINFDYDVSGDASKIQDFDLVIPKTKELLGEMHISTKGEKTFKVKNVLSSTTLELEDLGIVQLLGNLNPESDDETECIGELAVTKLENTVLNRDVYLEFDIDAKYDSNGRLLAYVYLENGYFINQQMIKEGLSYALGRDVSNHYKYSQFKSFESQANLLPTGVWVNNVCNTENSSSSSSSSISSFISSIATPAVVFNPVVNTPISSVQLSSQSSSSSLSQSSEEISSQSEGVSSSQSSSSEQLIDLETSESSSSEESQASESSISSSQVQSSVEQISIVWGGYIEGSFDCHVGYVSGLESAYNYDSLEECISYKLVNNL